MTVFDIYSRRLARQQQGEPDIYQYGHLPEALRHQVIHIWSTALGPHVVRNPMGPSRFNRAYERLERQLARELGVPRLNEEEHHADRCETFLLSAPTIDEALDIVEMSFAMIDGEVRDDWSERRDSRNSWSDRQSPDEAIDELNQRFQQHAIGYRFERGRIIRIDSEYLHQAVVKPALRLLSDPAFAGADEEFLKAHEHYRHGRHHEALVDALKAFESTLKIVCKRRRWTIEEGKATAAALVRTLLKQNVLPSWMENGLVALATLRNNLGGHGQGSEPTPVPAYLVAHALHLAAANIVLVVEAADSPT